MLYCTRKRGVTQQERQRSQRTHLLFVLRMERGRFEGWPSPCRQATARSSPFPLALARARELHALLLVQASGASDLFFGTGSPHSRVCLFVCHARAIAPTAEWAFLDSCRQSRLQLLFPCLLVRLLVSRLRMEREKLQQKHD